MVVISIIITLRFIFDLRDLPTRAYAVVGYIAAIGRAGDRYSKASEYLNYTRQALESGNWMEAFRWLSIVGIPGDARIPKQILEKVWKFE